MILGFWQKKKLWKNINGDVYLDKLAMWIYTLISLKNVLQENVSVIFGYSVKLSEGCVKLVTDYSKVNDTKVAESKQ